VGKIPHDVTESVVILEKAFPIIKFLQRISFSIVPSGVVWLKREQSKKGVIYWTYSNEFIQKKLNPKKLNFPKATEVSA